MAETIPPLSFLCRMQPVVFFPSRTASSSPTLRQEYAGLLMMAKPLFSLAHESGLAIISVFRIMVAGRYSYRDRSGYSVFSVVCCGAGKACHIFTGTYCAPEKVQIVPGCGRVDFQTSPGGFGESRDGRGKCGDGSRRAVDGRGKINDGRGNRGDGRWKQADGRGRDVSGFGSGKGGLSGGY